MNLNILIAPSGFKESLGADEVARQIAAGIATVLPDARIMLAPMADGGEGFTQALVGATGGTLLPARVTGPLGDPVDAWWGLLGGREERTAVVEMAAAAGLWRVPRDRRDPTRTTSFGVGELIRAALDRGATRILLGCGDSGVNDGGAGMVEALGARLLDAAGRPIGPGGGALVRLARIDLTGLDPRLADVRLDAAVNWHNALLGERGVARVYGPQKGATPAQIELLDAAMRHWSDAILETTGIDMSEAPGAGASGGLGAGFAGLLGGTLHPRFDVVMRYLEIDTLLDQADLVFTAEGRLDDQTPHGKVPAEVARRAKLRGLPVIALAGSIGRGVDANLAVGIDAFASIVAHPCTLEEAIARAATLLRHAAADAARMLRVGRDLARHPSAGCCDPSDEEAGPTAVHGLPVRHERKPAITGRCG